MSKGRFEAINYALRKSKDGVIVSFVVHPNDLDTALTALPIGAIVNIEWSEPDEKPAARIAPEQPAPASIAGPPQVLPKPKRKFSELSPTEQAGIRCNDPEFQEYLGAKDRDEAAGMVRLTCGVQSRSDLSAQPAANKWAAMNDRFEMWQTTKKYADVRR